MRKATSRVVETGIRMSQKTISMQIRIPNIPFFTTGEHISALLCLLILRDICIISRSQSRLGEPARKIQCDWNME